MEEKIYACRTEEISGITYRVKILKDGVVIMSTSYEDKDKAEAWAARIVAVEPSKGYSFEISSHPWTSNVCIECGREEY